MPKRMGRSVKVRKIIDSTDVAANAIPSKARIRKGFVRYRADFLMLEYFCPPAY